jgi:hypothetical protein
MNCCISWFLAFAQKALFEIVLLLQCNASFSKIRISRQFGLWDKTCFEILLPLLYIASFSKSESLVSFGVCQMACFEILLHRFISFSNSREFDVCHKTCFEIALLLQCIASFSKSESLVSLAFAKNLLWDPSSSSFTLTTQIFEEKNCYPMKNEDVRNLF